MSMPGVGKGLEPRKLSDNWSHWSKHTLLTIERRQKKQRAAEELNGSHQDKIKRFNQKPRTLTGKFQGSSMLSYADFDVSSFSSERWK